MEFIFQTLYVSVEFPVTGYRILEVDTNVYFANPVTAWPYHYYQQPPEFYFTKIKGKWLSDIYVRNDLLESLGKELGAYLSSPA